MKRSALCLLVALAGCGDGWEPPDKVQVRDRMERTPMPELEPPAPTAGDRAATDDAAAALKAYYARIEAGDYDSAWAMRSGDGSEAARTRFADNFRAYARYHAEVGAPSEPVKAGDWSYVEVPVMIQGTFRGGKPFSSAGSVTLRRAAGPGTAGGWRIYTGER